MSVPSAEPKSQERVDGKRGIDRVLITAGASGTYRPR